MEEKYIGHVNSETKEIQSLKVHLENVRYLAEKNCPLELFRYIVQVTALIHDMENMQFAIRLIIHLQGDCL